MFAGYTVRNMLAVTLNDPVRVETVISRTLDAGINYLLGVEFQTSELKKYREQARELAVKAAREKADKMAATLGATVGSAIQINEAGQNWSCLLFQLVRRGMGQCAARELAQQPERRAGGQPARPATQSPSATSASAPA